MFVNFAYFLKIRLWDSKIYVIIRVGRVGDKMMKQLMKQLRHNLQDLDKMLLLASIIFFIFGLLCIVSASSREAVVRYDVSMYHYFFQQIKMLGIGFIFFLIIINIDTKKYPFWVAVAYFVILVILIYLSVSGTEQRGAKNWVRIAGISFQPSEFAKPIIIVSLASLFDIFKGKLKNKRIPHYDMISMILGVGLIIPIIVFFQKDFGTMLIMLTIFFVMFFASPILRWEKIKTFLLLIILGICAAALMILVRGHIFSEAQKARFDFFDPCSNYEAGGYQVCNGFIAFNNGGIVGVGIGRSTQTYSYIPEPHTDSIFAIIGEELGFFWCSPLFIAYLFIIKRILNLSARANTVRGKFICLGVATYIFAHIFINMGGLFGVIPLTGVPLPFLSYGGSFAISLIASLSFVQRVHIETKNQKISIGGRI